jgi:hypothetical protein
MVGVGIVGNLGVQDLGIGGARIVQELLDLVAADIAQDAAVLLALKEPSRALGLAQAVRGEIDHLEDAPNPALVDQLPSQHRALDVQALAEVDVPLQPGPLDALPGPFKLLAVVKGVLSVK